MDDKDCGGCLHATPTVTDDDDVTMKCRRYPPVLFILDGELTQTFPDAYMRCGEYVRTPGYIAPDQMETHMICRSCDGRGFYRQVYGSRNQQTCSVCQGSGITKKPTPITEFPEGYEACRECRGSTIDPHDGARYCRECGGTGVLWVGEKKFENCPACHGIGTYVSVDSTSSLTCQVCFGSGMNPIKGNTDG